MARFSQTFNSIYNKRPFSDQLRIYLRYWAESLRLELVDFQTYVDDVYECIFITEIPTFVFPLINEDFDAWGEVLDLPRNVAETDAAYQARLLVEWRASDDALTIQAITDAVDAVGATYIPVLAVDRIDEYYELKSAGGRREDTDGIGDTWSLGPDWGLSDLDLLTIGIVLDRIPTPAEALEIAETVRDYKAANIRAQILTENPGGPPTTYTLYATAY